MSTQDTSAAAESADTARAPETSTPAEPAPAESTSTESTSGESTPGVIATAGKPYFPIALIARFPYAMMVIGVLTIVVSARGSLSLGGITSATVGLGIAIFGPLIGAAADRWGQRPVLLIAGAASSLALLGLAWVVYSPLPPAAVLVSAFLVGATTPQVPPMSRSRLVGIITHRLPYHRRQKTMNSTMAYESAADEVTFVFGPMIVGLLASTMGAAAPIIGAAVLTLIFLSSFALHRSSHEVPKNSSADTAPAPVRELFAPRLLVIVAGVFGVGLIFGSTLTTLTSFMDDAGHPERAGLVYGVMGIGSAAFALAAALFPTSFSMRARWLSFGALILLGSLGMQGPGSIPILLVALMVMGIGVGPTLVTQFSLVAERSPHGRSATVMSMASTAIMVGQSAAAAVTGDLAENYGSETAAVMPLAASVIIILAALTNARLSSR